MVRDGLSNMVSRLTERGFDPRKVGADAWESRCPAHRSRDRALSITRNEFNHVVLTCGAETCQHTSIIRALGFTNDHLYAETPHWLISQLRRVEIQPALFASENVGDRNGDDSPTPEGACVTAEVPPDDAPERAGFKISDSEVTQGRLSRKARDLLAGWRNFDRGASSALFHPVAPPFRPLNGASTQMTLSRT